MSIAELHLASQPPTGDATWSRVSASLWVASTRTDFLGTVEAVHGRYRAFDQRGILISEAPELEAAMAHVLHPGGRAYDRRARSDLSRGDQRLMRATAIVAGAVTVVSVVMLMSGLGS